MPVTTRFSPRPLQVLVHRGRIAEARHHVDVAVVQRGRLVAAWGDWTQAAYLRSVAKPLHALALAGVVELPADELAATCASHDGGLEAVSLVERLLRRADATASDLHNTALPHERLSHSCSGNHAGMLVLAHAHGWSRVGYWHARHPVQIELRSRVADLLEATPKCLIRAHDGCGIPTYAATLFEIARAYATLAAGQRPYIDICDAMKAFPHIVSGPYLPDYAVMKANPSLVAKVGVEGLLAIGMPDGGGVALKSRDGSYRPLRDAAGFILGLVTLGGTQVWNDVGTNVGRITISSG